MASQPSLSTTTYLKPARCQYKQKHKKNQQHNDTHYHDQHHDCRKVMADIKNERKSEQVLLLPPPLLLFTRYNDPLPSRPTTTTTPCSSNDSSILRCVVLSDTHGKHHRLPNPLPAGDVLIHCGDIANRGNIQDIRSFASYLQAQQPHFQKDNIVIIQGNHDRDLYHPERIDLKRELGHVAHVVQDEIITVADNQLSILGVSWETCERSNYTDIQSMITPQQHEKQQSSSSSAIAVDILLTHLNPRVSGRKGGGWNGSRNITKLVKQYKIPLHCFGHVHHARGICKYDYNIDGGSSSSSCIMVNCSTTWNQPVVIDYCTIKKKVKMVHCPGQSPPSPDIDGVCVYS